MTSPFEGSASQHNPHLDAPANRYSQSTQNAPSEIQHTPTPIGSQTEILCRLLSDPCEERIMTAYEVLPQRCPAETRKLSILNNFRCETRGEFNDVEGLSHMGVLGRAKLHYTNAQSVPKMAGNQPGNAASGPEFMTLVTKRSHPLPRSPCSLGGIGLAPFHPSTASRIPGKITDAERRQNMIFDPPRVSFLGSGPPDIVRREFSRSLITVTSLQCHGGFPSPIVRV